MEVEPEKAKFYGVVIHGQLSFWSGVYNSWEEAKKANLGVSHSTVKRFSTEEETKRWVARERRKYFGTNDYFIKEENGKETIMLDSEEEGEDIGASEVLIFDY